MSDDLNVAEETAAIVPYVVTKQFQQDVSFIKARLIAIGEQMADDQAALDAQIQTLTTAVTALQNDVTTLQTTNAKLITAVNAAIASLPAPDFTPEVTALQGLVSTLSSTDTAVQGISSSDAAETTSIEPAPAPTPEPPAST